MKNYSRKLKTLKTKLISAVLEDCLKKYPEEQPKMADVICDYYLLHDQIFIIAEVYVDDYFWPWIVSSRKLDKNFENFFDVFEYSRDARMYGIEIKTPKKAIKLDSTVVEELIDNNDALALYIACAD